MKISLIIFNDHAFYKEVSGIPVTVRNNSYGSVAEATAGAVTLAALRFLPCAPVSNRAF